MVEQNFCSNCKWARIVELQDGFKISCQRLKNPTNYKSAAWANIRGKFRKFNAPACVAYEELEP